jgi:O-antigen/teichoic acid export membrane protein
VSVAGQMIVMTGRQKMQLINMTAILAINILLNLILIPKFQILGAAAATAISLTLFSLLETIEILLLFKIFPFRKDFFKPLVAGTISLFVLYLLSSLGLSASMDGLMLLVVNSTIFFVLYFIATYLIGLQEEDKYLLAEIKTRISQSWANRTGTSK